MAQFAIRRGRERFPRTVDSVDELPLAVAKALEQHHAVLDPGKMIVIPPQQYVIPRRTWRRVLPFAWRWTPHRTLVFGDERIVIVEGTTEDALNTLVIPTMNVIAIQIDVVLLYSYFALSWTADNRVDHCKIEFNAVALRLFEPALQRVQQLNAETSLSHFHAAPPQVTTRHFPLKFHNYAHISVMPDETIRFAIYHPALRQPGKRFRPYVSPNRAILLTEQHLIVLEDELSHIKDFHGNKYRINRFFFPRGKIVEARSEVDSGADWLCVTIGTPDANEDIRLALPQAQIDDILREFEHWFLRKIGH